MPMSEKARDRAERAIVALEAQAELALEADVFDEDDLRQVVNRATQAAALLRDAQALRMHVASRTVLEKIAATRSRAPV